MPDLLASKTTVMPKVVVHQFFCFYVDDTVNAIQGKTSSFASQSPAVSSVAASEKNTSSSTDGFGSGSAVNLALGDEDFSVIQTNLHLKSSEAPTKSSIADSRKPYDQLSNVTRKNFIDYAVNKSPEDSNGRHRFTTENDIEYESPEDSNGTHHFTTKNDIKYAVEGQSPEDSNGTHHFTTYVIIVGVLALVLIAAFVVIAAVWRIKQARNPIFNLPLRSKSTFCEI